MDYGAVGNGTTDDTAAFQKALDAAAAAGGGTVHAPRGNYFFAGHLNVPDAVTLAGLWQSVPAHNGIRQLVGDLNALYRSHPALYEVDFESSGFEWINWEDRDASVLSWVRYARDGSFLVVVANFTPVVREHYQLGVPRAGAYRERLNTDAETYGGSNVGNLGEVSATHDPVNGRPASLSLTLPPLAALILQPAD